MTGTMTAILAATVILTALVTFFVSRSILVSKFREERARYGSTISLLEQRLDDTRKHHENAVAILNDSHDKAVVQLKASHQQALNQQLEALKAQMTMQTEQILKAREEELDRKAKETFGHIAEGLDKDIRSMKEAFESNRKTHTETSRSLRDDLDNAVRNIKEQTMEIGGKADNLAEALRGGRKVQGNWGEVILDNLFAAEGLREGRDYHREETLRDEQGNAILNEDSRKMMRPDFILHYPDGNDIVVDSKVVLTAMYDWHSAADEASRSDAMQRNLAAMKEQVRRLAKKDYSRYIRPGHRMLDYVIMFVPVYSALRLAYEADRNLWHDAYRQGVLITTEETLMPFLRMISIAWKSHEQVANQQQIIAAAEMMLSRVSDFCSAHARMGEKLEEALKQYEVCDRKIRERGQSIVGAANRLISYGVPKNPRKPIPSEYGMED